MSKREKSERVATNGGTALGQNPFGALSAAELPEAKIPALQANPAPTKPKSRGRLEIRRLKAGRGGKTVTLVSGFSGIGAAEKDALCKTLHQACSCGGTVNENGEIEIQGDQRERIAALLREKGFQPVFAGG
ncbi:hypothetical protein AXK12_01280 [Cephaloticoccus capnophilus]|uniref:SUI1 domain-containing protein n=1 Tax=Cephaloticoccus capnophilus TaxID=1548208 RepID=A0A139STC0_9BACT|nr:translation initiation factor [Cephaloticoccus capnophilus]KXU37823.1 hypothetical protein AXK12_01280 [Cephaloticoccus capnophilus]